MTDIFDSGTPKYSTAQDIYDALCELVQTEEMGILGEMFADVSWDNQEYYYTDKGYKLKEKFEEVTDYCEKMWLIDLTIWQLDRTDVHDLVYEALLNEDMAKRVGFKKLFIDEMLLGDKSDYDEIAEAYVEELHELNRFWFNSMAGTFKKVMEARGGWLPVSPYGNFCNKFYDKLSGLKLQEETRLVSECRALLTSYDDFMFGLRSNQHLYTQLEQQYQAKAAALQASYEEKVRQLFAIAERQGVVLALGEEIKILPEEAQHGQIHF